MYALSFWLLYKYWAEIVLPNCILYFSPRTSTPWYFHRKRSGFKSPYPQLSNYQHLYHTFLSVFIFFRSHVSLTLPCCSCPQISKLSMIPVVCVMEWILHSKQYSREVKMAVVVVVLGVGVCTVTDVKVNVKGFVCACVAVLSTSLQQIVSISVIYYSFLH